MQTKSNFIKIIDPVEDNRVCHTICSPDNVSWRLSIADDNVMDQTLSTNYII